MNGEHAIDHYPDHVRGTLNYTALAFSMLGYVPSVIARQLIRDNRWDDMRQTVYMAALECYEVSATVKETRARTMQYIGDELRQNGLVRSRTEDGSRPIVNREELYDPTKVEWDSPNSGEGLYTDIVTASQNQTSPFPDPQDMVYETEPTEVELPPVLLGLLDKMADATGMTFDEVVTEAVTHYLAQNSEKLVK